MIAALAIAAVLGAELTHDELGVTIDLPDGWVLDRECGPFVPPAAQCRLDGGVGACGRELCPERVGVLWLRAPAVLTSLDDEKAELLEAPEGWATSLRLKDGWVLTWGSAALTDAFPFLVSRKIGARVIECSGAAQSLVGQRRLIEACRSIKPLVRRK